MNRHGWRGGRKKGAGKRHRPFFQPPYLHRRIFYEKNEKSARKSVSFSWTDIRTVFTHIGVFRFDRICKKMFETLGKNRSYIKRDGWFFFFTHRARGGGLIFLQDINYRNNFLVFHFCPNAPDYESSQSIIIYFRNRARIRNMWVSL